MVEKFNLKLELKFGIRAKTQLKRKSVIPKVRVTPEIKDSIKTKATFFIFILQIYLIFQNHFKPKRLKRLCSQLRLGISSL